MTSRGGKDPEQAKVRFHTGSRRFRKTEIRRASEQTSPQVARAAGRTQRWDEGGGSGVAAVPIRRCPFQGRANEGPDPDARAGRE